LEKVPDSPSTWDSEGPAEEAPVEASRTQFTAFLRLAVVPEMVSGSQIYVLRIKLLDTQRSPMYMKLSPTGRMKVV
jgi:hypothetical protein